MAEAYAYLMDVWEPGDQVFLFGFSRGAYTARVLAAVLHAFGLLPRGNTNLVPYVLRLLRAARAERNARTATSGLDRWTKLCDDFRWTFGRQVVEGDQDRRFGVHFLGLWDTVSSVGWVWNPTTFPYTATNPSVNVIRHAVSIDERRVLFRQNLMHQATPAQDLMQIWFSGVHSDVGGGYPENDGGLWRKPFSWILDDAVRAGLLVDATRLRTVMTRTPESLRPYDDPKQESLRRAWWLAEILPKFQWRPNVSRSVLTVGLGRYRTIGDGELIHRWALLRLQDETDYRPKNMSPAFVETVRALSPERIPDVIPYASDGGTVASTTHPTP